MLHSVEVQKKILTGDNIDSAVINNEQLCDIHLPNVQSVKQGIIFSGEEYSVVVTISRNDATHLKAGQPFPV